jgi:hypothetical protein
MLSVMTVDEDRPGDGFRDFGQSLTRLLRVATVAERQVDVSQQVSAGRRGVRRGSVHAEDRLDTEGLQLSERGGAFGFAPGEQLIAEPEQILDAGAGNLLGGFGDG